MERLMAGLPKRKRLAIGSFLMLALLANSLGAPAANAFQSLSAYFGPVCIEVIELSEDSILNTRNDLAERVGSTVRAKVEVAEGKGKRKVSTWPRMHPGGSTGI
jgi:hypothetical protein